MSIKDDNADAGSRPALNKTGSSGRNIYGSMVRKTSEKHLYGDRSDSIDDKKKTHAITTERLKTIKQEPDMVKLRPVKIESQNNLSRSNSLKKDILIKQQTNINISVLTSTPTNQKPPTSILNNSNTSVRSRAGTFKTNSDGDGSNTDSGLKTPVSAIQFQFEDKVPLRRLPHQHRGSMTPRVNASAVPSDLINEANGSDSYTNSRIQNISRNSSIISNVNRKVSIALPNKEKKVTGSPSGGTNSSDAPLSAISMNSSNNNSSFLSVSINDIVAQLTGKVDAANAVRKASSVEIPGGFGEDNDENEASGENSRSASPLSAISATSTSSKKSVSQLVSIDSLIAKNESESKFTKQKISEFLPKQDDGKYHILLGGTGSVASIKIPLIANKLLKYYTPSQCSVQIVLTKSAMKFVRGLKISPHVKIWTDDDLNYLSDQPYKMGDPTLQVELRRWADVFVIAPLSANTLAKISNGISDNLLTNIVRGWPVTSTPLYLAPAMNTFMYIHPLTKIQLQSLSELLPTVEILKPVEKVLVCGDIGMGGMREWTDICALVINRLDKMNKDEADDEDEDDFDEDDDDEDDDDSRINMDETDDYDHSEGEITTDVEGN
jgi:phosphopantothenoylcysteine decarboxylase